jgi:hypothetical protein
MHVSSYPDRMPYMTTTGTMTRRARGPEEIVLEAWLEDSGPYMKLDAHGPKMKATGKYVEPGRTRVYDTGAA